jgi:histidinol-phosphate/aromatic aminotransferase/cobyric acid decarboxylase-like protein
MIKLNLNEQLIEKKIMMLKDAAGSHSPNVSTMRSQLPSLKIKVDACFLSNPYATDLFIKHLKEDLIDTGIFRDVLEYYPSQNSVIAGVLSKTIEVNRENIFVSNGAIEAIQAVMHNFVSGKLIVNIPTFSSYYEFANDQTEIIYYQLERENDFQIRPDDYISFVKKHNPSSIIIINPNNPNGGYLAYSELRYILNSLKEIDNIIIDESFIHFAYEDSEFNQLSAVELFNEFSNIIVIKSMSKDFGIAGIRAGYAIMDQRRVSRLLRNGHLWNVSGLGEYFFTLLRSNSFQLEYERVRKKYIHDAQLFFDDLSKVESIKVYPSKANFALIELIDGSTAADFIAKMLISYGIYTRTCSDKIGLNGEYIRIAGRKKEENNIISSALNSIFE